MNATIRLSQETKNKIATFGIKEESYDIILKRICKLAVKEQLREFLMSEEGCVPIREAIKESEKRWPKINDEIPLQ